MSTRALSIAFYACLAAFVGASAAAFLLPSLVLPAAAIAVVAGTAAGPLSTALEKRSRG